MRNLFDVGCQPKVTDNTIKNIELKLAAHIACHSSIATVDHLGELVRDFSDKGIAVHRTKCTALIKWFLSPSMHKNLLVDLKRYTLLRDY